MEVTGQLHAPVALYPGKEPLGTRLIGGWVGLRAGLDAVARRKIAGPCWELNPSLVVRSLVTTLTELPRLTSKCQGLIPNYIRIFRAA
jgi:hypothetical protein